MTENQIADPLLNPNNLDENTQNTHIATPHTMRQVIDGIQVDDPVQIQKPINPLQMQIQKTEYSRSYLFNVPNLDAQTREQLYKYRVVPSIPIDMNIEAEVSLRLTMENQRKIAGFFFFMVCIFEVMLLVFYLASNFMSGRQQESFVVCIEIFLGLVYIAIGEYVVSNNYLKYELKMYKKIFTFSWLGFIAGSINYFYSIQNLVIFYILLFLLFVYSCFSGKYEGLFHLMLFNTACAFFLYLMYVFGGLTYRSVCGIKNGQDQIDKYIFMALVVVQILIMIYVKMRRGQNTTSKYAYFELCCMLYLATVGLSFALSNLFQFPYHFVIFTQLINIVFIPLCVYFSIEINKSQQDIQQIIQKLEKVTLYQRSNTQLSYHKQQALAPQEQPYTRGYLTSCIMCMSEQSRFFYNGCMHVCCGYSCIVAWLRAGNSNCPLCRRMTDFIGEVKRVNDFEFVMLNKYKTRNMKE